METKTESASSTPYRVVAIEETTLPDCLWLSITFGVILLGVIVLCGRNNARGYS